ncbi:MAG: DUF2283 domain-containing protein [Nitrospirae bacterium]|nr:DUF2283 domain-containing protein [Nitrospirota bacterium]
MKIQFDSRQNIAYIGLREKPAQVQTIKISDELNVDLAPDGTIYGIELLNANEQLLSLGNGQLVFEDQSTGNAVGLMLPR